MTPDEINDFRDFGCASRCILYLAKANGISLTDDEFAKRYNALFRCYEGKKRVGLVTDDGAKFICKDLGIASSTQTFAKFSTLPTGKVNGILVFTKKKPESGGTWSDYNHCGLIDPNSIGQSTVSYGQVGQNIQAVFQSLPEPFFAMWLPEYVVLLP